MKQKTKKRPQIISVAIALACLICLILVIDFVVRTVTRANVTYVVSEGTFSTDTNNGIPEATDKPTEAKDNKKDNETVATTKNDDPNYDTITLSDSDLHNGSLVMVSNTCPYSGKTDFTDFSTLSDTSLKPRSESLTFQTEMRNPLINLFDAYQASQGTVNLQIHSTSVTNTDSDSLYTNVLAERSSGYTFDIGLITSTGEVVAYLTKRNEWMVANCWYYGFILRYPDDKTSITGISNLTKAHRIGYIYGAFAGNTAQADGVNHFFQCKFHFAATVLFLAFIKEYQIVTAFNIGTDYGNLCGNAADFLRIVRLVKLLCQLGIGLYLRIGLCHYLII